MRLLRKKFLTRSLSLLFLLIFLQSVFVQNYSWALTTGPHQPEFTSYEEPGATDMVNMLTGDFSLSLPVLEVPGPEGSFSLPLTYNAGVGPDQEASWVGLGWTMNAGAITRIVNAFPDDAVNQSHSITMQDLDVVRGWTSSALGLGNIGWNNIDGHYGSVSLFGLVDVQYDKNGTSVGVAGISVGHGTVGFDPVKFSLAVLTVVTAGAAAEAAGAEAYGAAMTSDAIENGTAQAAANAASKAAVSSSLMKQAAQSLGSGAAMSAVFSSSTPAAPLAGNWQYTKVEKQGLFHKDYWIWLDQTRVENMYGTLYMGYAPNINYPGSDFALSVAGTNQTIQYPDPSGTYIYQGAASDISQYIDAGVKYQYVDNPVAIATDNYSVKAFGVSGSITPYRLDIGSVSMPREMSSFHTRFSPVKFLNTYKVPFIYEGDASGSHFYQVGSGSPTVSSPTFYFGGAYYLQSPNFKIDVNDIIVNPSARTRPDMAANINNYRLPKTTHVEWMSNAEILNETTRSAVGFMDFLSVTDRANFRTSTNLNYQSMVFYSSTMTGTSPADVTFPISNTSNFLVGDIVDINLSYTPQGGGEPDIINVQGLAVTSKDSQSITVTSSSLYNLRFSTNKSAEIILRKGIVSPAAIGGYAITAANGMTYHFALPSLDANQITEIKDKDHPTTKKTTLNRVGAFANTWILTAITGPDFVDRSPAGPANGIVDDSDWGYWIKLNYGNYSNSFKWRLPYTNDKRDAGNLSDTNTSGVKQIHYLNSIETRSHVALFIKDVRLDSRSADVSPVQSMKLNEICLVKKNVYQKLIASTGSGGYGVTDFSANISNICSINSFTSPALAYLYQNVVKRIGFTYTYDLCPGTLNSIAPNTGGKLTLTRLSIMGKDSAKVTPDYLFEYANNPAYGAEKWDGWGMYNSSGVQTNHNTSNIGSDGAAWSLTKVTNPLGSELNVTYERDTYSSVSGQVATDVSVSFLTNVTTTSINSMTIDDASNLSVNDMVNISGSWECMKSGTEYSGNYSVSRRVTAISGNTITVDSDFGGATACSGATITFQGSVAKTSNIKGGDIRVACITLTDQGKQYKTRYLYCGTDGITSSGVVSQEPEYVRHSNYSFYNLPGYPVSPVMYGTVTVLNGNLSNDSDYYNKQVYKFETPNSSMLVYNKSVIANQTSVPVPSGSGFLTLSNHKMESYLSQIGRVNSVETYDQTTLRNKTEMFYTSTPTSNVANSYMGTYARGAFILEKVIDKDATSNAYYRFSRTTQLTYPNVLSRTKTTKDGLVTESENLKWDYYSASVIEKIDRSALGLNVKTVMKPAYLETQYAELGPKALNLSNRQILNANGSSYTYRTDATGNTIYGLLSASAQTWKKDWINYRGLSAGSYVDQADPGGVPGIWRKSASYVYKGTYAQRQTDGTLSYTGTFDYSNPGGNANWQYTGESKRFDHFSMPLETVDMNAIASAVKMGYGDQLKIAEAGNAGFMEMAFSSAEDLNSTTGFFGGEVALVSSGGSASISSTAHTGSSSLSLASGYGFVYKPLGLKLNRTYRASVWTNSTNGRVYYKLNGGTEQLSTAPTQSVAGWYRIDFQIPIGSSFTSLEVGVKSQSGTVLFDDFRFQPIDAGMTTYVYDVTTGQLTHVLDNDNLFIKYEYNNRGLLTKTYRESLKFNGIKLVTESKDNYRRFYTNP